MLTIVRTWIAALALALGVVPAALAQGAPGDAGARAFSQQELDQMLAPIALYPDPLLTQILMASTYPLEVVKAARWSRAHPALQGDDAVRAAAYEDWDPSVKSLVAFPRVLEMMDARIDWTEQLGEAFLAQEPYVLETVQELRRRAYAAGNLRSNPDTLVAYEGNLIVVQPVNPLFVYVPYYDPWYVYGTWWWPNPPVYWAPWPGYVRPGVSVSIYWGSAIRLSTGFFYGTFDWHHHRVDVRPVTNFYYRPRVTHSAPVRWQHEVQHRRGVEYRHTELRQRYPQPRTTQPRRNVPQQRAAPQYQRPTPESRRYEPQSGRSQPRTTEPRRNLPQQRATPQRGVPAPEFRQQPAPERRSQQHSKERSQKRYEDQRAPQSERRGMQRDDARGAGRRMGDR